MSINDLLDMDLMPLLFIFSIIGVVLLLIGNILAKKQKEENMSKPIIENQVKVISKTVNPTTQNGFVVFEFESGERKEFFVRANNFKFISENDIGCLKSQGNICVEFKRNV